MLPNVILHKYDISFREGGHDKDKKVSIIGALVNNLGPMEDKDGMDMMSMVVSIVGRMCSGVVGPFRS